MSPEQLQEKLTELIQKAITLKDTFRNCPQLYVIPEDDAKFALEEMNRPVDYNSKLDILAKLFIAYYLDYIPSRIVNNLENNANLYRNNEGVKDYFLALAGYLHEAKLILLEQRENMLPYLISYKEYLGDRAPGEVIDADLVGFFASIVEDAIQAVINFNG